MDGAPPQSLPVPPGGDVDKGPIINAFAWWTTVVTLVLVALRIYTHTRIIRTRFSWDDWHLMLAEIGIVAIAALTTAEVSQGFGRHEHYLSDLDVINFLTLNFASWVITFLVLGYTKLSLLLFCLKLRPGVWVRRVLFSGAIAIVLSSFVFIMLFVLQCVPPNAAWRLNVHAKCMSRTAILNNILAQAVVSAVYDFGLALFPLLLVWSLRMSRWKQVGLCCITLLGILTGVCAVVRAATNAQAIADDATFTTVANWFWRLFEMQLSVVCACIPSLIPLYQHVAGKYGGHKRSSLTSLMNAFPSASSSQTRKSSKSTSAASEITPWETVGSSSKTASDATDGRRKVSSTETQRRRPSIRHLGVVTSKLDATATTAQDSDATPKTEEQQDEESKRKHALTFLADDSQEDLSQSGSAPKKRPVNLAKARKSVSFRTARDDLHPTMRTEDASGSSAAAAKKSRPPVPSLPPVVFKRPDASSKAAPSATTRPAVVTPPLGEASGSVPLQPLARAHTDPEPATPSQSDLAMDMSPSFQRNRTAFGRILGVKRASWASSLISGRSNNRGQGQGADIV